MATKKKRQKQPYRGKLSSQEPGRKWLALRFILTYVLLMGILLLLIGLKAVKSVVDINGLYTEMILALSRLALEPFGVVQGTSGSIIALSGINLDVQFGCNGLEAFLIYSVGVLAFPSKALYKGIGILGGFVVLQAVNVLRIAGLGLSGVYLEEYFEIIHIYVAQGIMIALALVLFLVWMHYATKA